MTISECYDLFQAEQEWNRLASNCRQAVRRTLVKKYGDHEVNELHNHFITEWIGSSGRPERDKVQTESVIRHMLGWAHTQGLYDGDVVKKVTTIRLKPKASATAPKPKTKYTTWYTGTIYTELHNHGRRTNGSQDGNRSSVQFVKGAGLTRRYGYRWVAEITFHKHRYRCRSYSYSRVREWLDEMCARFS